LCINLVIYPESYQDALSAKHNILGQTVYFKIKSTALCGHINKTCFNISLLTAHEYPRLVLFGSISAEDVCSNGISAGSTGKHTALWKSSRSQ